MNIIEKRWQELENKVVAEMRETIGDEKKALEYTKEMMVYIRLDSRTN